MPSAIALKRREIKQRLVKIHVSQLGYSETGDNDNKYGRWYGMNHVPWCAEYQSWVSDQAKTLSIIPKFAYTPAGADFYKGINRWGDKPRVGAIVFFDTAGLGRISHVGFVTKVNSDGSFETIEGNTNAAGSREGTSVQRKHRTTVGPNGGFGYPRYDDLARKELGIK